jgi:hypothetical protein
MYNFLSKNGQTIATVIGAIIVVVFIAIAMGSVPEGLGPDTFKENDVPLPTEAKLAKLEEIKSFDFGLYATYALLAFAVAAAVILSLIYFVTNFSLQTVKGMLPVLVLLVIFFIVYSSYNPDTSDVYQVLAARKKYDVGVSESQLVSGALTTSIVALGGAVVSLVVMEVLNFFK